MITFRNAMLIGLMMAKIEYWTKQYEFSFQFWGEDNNVYINKDDVEITSFGGHESIQQILNKTIEWCEKANPRYKYPKGVEITNPQP